ncbi:MAG: helix-turn-helix transcriptional regulator [Gammaproteobacteria bacterium]|nr:helix-turn-helix transcriptional regulator [Gammaproteobacteria bacterium]
MLPSFSGARIRRVIDRSHACVPEHAHDWPLLSLFVMGSYLNHTELGQRFICGPSAVFYRAGAAHRNATAAVGFEQIEIEFDPSWLGSPLLPDRPVTLWTGGAAARQARTLARVCGTDPSEQHLRAAIRQLLEVAHRQAAPRPPEWMDAIARRLREDARLRIGELALQARRHPSWLGSAYRHATGEAVQETAARLRVESATHLLRETGQPLSSIALDAGFCDQSHMNRSFRRVLGRSPATVRLERREFRQTPR